LSGPSRGLHRYTGAEYQRLLAAARRSLERTGGALDSTISISTPDDAERRAVSGITGKHIHAGARRAAVTLAELDTAVRGGTGCGLAELLAALGGPLRNKPAEAASLSSARAELEALAAASHLHAGDAWFREWLDEMRRDGTLTRLATQPQVMRNAVGALEHLSGRPASADAPIALPALAALVTGDTKALNHGTTLATVVLRALALQAGKARPVSAAGRRELWGGSGVVVDDLSSRVLVLNVVGDGAGLGEWLSGAAHYGTPFQVTLHQLIAHPVQVSCRRIYVCENPAILRRACAELGPACPPVVCTEGRPSSAFHRLLTLAVSAGAEVWYHGDFDWPGVAIAADVMARYAGHAWQMGAAAYRQAGASGVLLTGEPVDTPWDPELREAMRRDGHAVYEEMVGDQLLADLAESGSTTNS
jgi:uncharacterized protein (TIGR02679 family)